MGNPLGMPRTHLVPFKLDIPWILNAPASQYIDLCEGAIDSLFPDSAYVNFHGSFTSQSLDLSKANGRTSVYYKQVFLNDIQAP